MKRILFALALLIVGYTSHAQTTDSLPKYKKDPTLPYFNILQGDSTWFNRWNIPKNKSVVIVYFSPECGHCQLTAQRFADSMSLFKNTFFVWISSYKPEQIKKFAHQYKLDQFDNVRLGRDTSYSIPVFYQVKFTPFMAIYNKKGNLVQAFEGGEQPSIIAKYSE